LTSFVDAVKESKCYHVNKKTQCFYADSSVLMSWDEARDFCARRNSTLPIITDEDVDNVFQQFIVSDSYILIQNRSVWIAAHARPVNNSAAWHWIDGQPSGKPSGRPSLYYISIFGLDYHIFWLTIFICNNTFHTVKHSYSSKIYQLGLYNLLCFSRIKYYSQVDPDLAGLSS